MSKQSRRPARSASQSVAPAPEPTASGSGARRSGDGSTTGGARGPSGAARQGRRERARPAPVPRSFLERNRLAIGIAAAVSVVALAGVFFLLSNAQPAFACSSLLTPAPAATPGPSGSPAPLGQPADDLGREHIAAGTSYSYAYCPPASGPHYGTAPDGPIDFRYYGPGETTKPEGWVHNLEHGGMVVLYRCSGSCDQATLDQLQQFEANLPASPICGLPDWAVVTRFDQMDAPVAVIVWDRVLFQQKVDTTQLLGFFKRYADRGPEQQCSPASASPGPAASAPAAQAPSPSPS